MLVSGAIEKSRITKMIRLLRIKFSGNSHITTPVYETFFHSHTILDGRINKSIFKCNNKMIYCS